MRKEVCSSSAFGHARWRRVFSLSKDYKGSHINKVAVDCDIFDSFEEEKGLFAEDLAYLFHLLQSGKIKGRVSSNVGFGMVEEEWIKCMEGKADGVVVLVSPFKEEYKETGSTKELISNNVKIQDNDDHIEMFIC